MSEGFSLPQNIGDWNSGTGFARSSKARQKSLYGAMRALLKVTALSCKDDKVSKQMQAYLKVTRKVRASKMDMGTWRQTYLGDVCPMLPGCEWQQKTTGGVPEWVCSFPWFSALPEGCFHLVHVHGGGMTGGDACGHQSLISHMARACKRPVHAPHYRLCPESTKYEAAEDVAKFIEALCSDGCRCIITADSGGAYAVHNAINRHSKVAQHIAHVIYISPMLGLAALDTPETSDEDDTMASTAVVRWCFENARIEAPEPVGLCIERDGKFYADKVTIFCGAGEIFRQDAKILSKALLDAGVDCELHMREQHPHAWFTLAGLGIPEIEESIRLLASLVFQSDPKCDASILQSLRLPAESGRYAYFTYTTFGNDPTLYFTTDVLTVAEDTFNRVGYKSKLVFDTVERNLTHGASGKFKDAPLQYSTGRKTSWKGVFSANLREDWSLDDPLARLVREAEDMFGNSRTPVADTSSAQVQ